MIRSAPYKFWKAVSWLGPFIGRVPDRTVAAMKDFEESLRIDKAVLRFGMLPAQ